MFGNTFGSKSQTWGGSYPVWRDVYHTLGTGGVFTDIPSAGETIPAATPVYQEKLGGALTPLKFFKVSAVSGTTITLVSGDGLPTPKVGDIIMKVPNSLSGTGASVTISAVTAGETEGTIVVTTDSALTCAKDNILTIAASAGSSVKMAVTSITGLTKDEVHIYEGDTVATGCIVVAGQLYIDRVAPIPSMFLALLPEIILNKEV